ncbi:DDE-domain-containing protein, partial [Fomitiporia mediterranea MF3/22]|uniref:DDE-domain-containing protein n=1 Tax=Fomitiporia mediterranea (strain MF3/22) TaxID=694068 RepID=UPI0004407F75
MPSQTKAAKINSDTQREAKIQEAINAIESGKIQNVTRAASVYQIPYRTLYNRYHHCHKNKYKAQASKKLLSNSAETSLSDWITLWGNNGTALNQRGVGSIVERISGVHPSDFWCRSFKARHPELKVSRASGLDPKRAQAFNPTTVNHHFSLLRDLVEKQSIPVENIYNMDEKGIQLGGGRKGRKQKFFFGQASHQRNCTRLRDGNLQLATIIECICANGSLVPPGFVLEGKQGFCPEWFNNAQIGQEYMVSITESGWTNDFICSEWFKQIFIPHPVLLIFDGHGSHLTDEMVELALQNYVHLYQLPAHTTHKLQPLDVGIFTHVQRKWEQYVDSVVETTGQGIKIPDIVHHYLTIRKESISPDTIKKAFTSSGISPVNP